MSEQTGSTCSADDLFSCVLLIVSLAFVKIGGKDVPCPVCRTKIKAANYLRPVKLRNGISVTLNNDKLNQRLLQKLKLQD